MGPDLCVVRRNTVRHKPSRVYTEEYMKTPKDLYKLHKLLTLVSDVMFFNGNVFIIASESKPKFGIVKPIQIRTAGYIIKSLNKVIKLYGIVGLILHAILMYMEF